MKHLVIAVLVAVASISLLVGALAHANPRLLASNPAASHPQDSTARRLLRNLAAGTFSMAPQQPTSAHNSTLNRPRVSYLEDGRIVVSMEAQGDISGDITLILDTNPDGSIRAGVWSLVSSYVEIIPPPAGGGGDGDGGERFIENGTLTGKTVSASVSFNADGSVASMNIPQLSVEGGSLTFSNISQGSGLVSGSNLSDQNTAAGNLVLNF